MRDILNFIKKKSTIILLIILVLMIAVILVFLGIFLPKTEGSVFGNRLDGIEKVPISEDLKSDIINTIMSTEKADKATITLTGKIIKVNINVKKDVSLADAKGIYSTFKPKFSEEILGYYDIEVMLVHDDYAAFGYLKAGRPSLKWTNNK